MKKNYIKEETIDRMRADEGLLLEFFREYISVSVSQNPNSLFQILYFSNKKITIVCYFSIHFSWVCLQKVESRIRTLSDLRELASAESLDSFTLIYSNILEHQPDCPVIIEDALHYILHCNVDTILYIYMNIYELESLKKNWNKLQAEVVEKLVALREGIPRKDAKEVILTGCDFLFLTLFFCYLNLGE